MQPLIKIAGVDRSSFILTPSIMIDNVINKRIDTCKFVLDDIDNDINPSNFEEITITNQAGTTYHFGGYITGVEYGMFGLTRRYRLQCQDYTVLLSRAIVNAVYESKTAAEIIVAAFAAYLPEIDVSTYVETGGRLFDKLVFNRTTLSQLVDTVCGPNSFDWYLDYQKNLHVFSKETNAAPFGISDAPIEPTTYACEALKYRKETKNIVNRYTVIGGYYLGPDTSIVLPADGTQTTTPSLYRWRPEVGDTKVEVYKNTGTEGTPVWTAQTVGIDYIDSLNDYDVLWNYNEKLIRWSSAPSQFDTAYKIEGRYEIPILLRVSSQLSYDTYGHWFDGKVVDPDITTRDAAKFRGKAELSSTAFERELGHYTLTDRDGLVAGQQQPITDSTRGIDDSYMLVRILTRFLASNVAQYEVDFGEYNPDLLDLLIKMKEAGYVAKDRREDEVLNELLEQAESLGLSESTDRHDDAEPLTGRWIVIPGTDDDNEGLHLVHEKLALAEVPARTDNYTEAYKWG